MLLVTDGAGAALDLAVVDVEMETCGALAECCGADLSAPAPPSDDVGMLNPVCKLKRRFTR